MELRLKSKWGARDEGLCQLLVPQTIQKNADDHF